MSDTLLPVRGSPGSPYTRKMLAVLRFRRIPYRYLQSGSDDLPEPKVKLIPIFYFPDETGELVAEVDSTPIIPPPAREKGADPEGQCGDVE